MGKSFFELDEPDEKEPEQEPMSARLAAIGKTPLLPAIDTAMMDAAASPFGFTSREPGSKQELDLEPRKRGRYRNTARAKAGKEKPKFIALNCPPALYDRFVGFADRNGGLTYNEALAKLLEMAGC